MREKTLKFSLFYLANEEIQQKTEQENSKYICYFEFSYSVFPIKEQEFQKKFCRSLPYFSIYPGHKLNKKYFRLHYL